MQQEEENLKPEIKTLLEKIESMSSLVFAEACADRLTHKKHSYSVCGYMSQLRKITKLLEAGAEQMEALEIVDSCIDIDGYLRVYGEER